MLIDPGINKLLEKVENRYTLVIEAAKRARQLSDGAEPLVDCEDKNFVTIASHEIANDKVTYAKTKIGIK